MSSRLRRLFFREGTSKLEWSSTVNRNAPPVFVPELIRNRITNVTEPSHLEQVSRYDPLGKFFTHGMATRVFDDWFVFRDADGEEVLQEAQEQLKRLNAKKIFTQLYAAELAFGYCWEYTGKNRYIPASGEGGRIATLHYFTPLNCSVFEYDETGNPKTMKIELNVGKAGSIVGEVLYLPASDFIPWVTRPEGRGYTGRSILEPIWDMLTYIRYEFHSMTWYDIKIGHGIFAAYAKAGFGEENLAKWQSAFEDISVKRAMVLDKDQVEKVEFVQANAQATSFVDHINACMMMVAIGAEMPKDLIAGVAAGAVTGSDVNLKLMEIVEREFQKAVEPYIWQTIERMGFARKDYVIDWNVKYAQDEEERAKIEQTHAQALATKLAYMTIDEVRAEEGLPPLPEGRGDMLSSETSNFNIGVQGLQTPQQQDKTNNPEGKQL